MKYNDFDKSVVSNPFGHGSNCINSAKVIACILTEAKPCGQIAKETGLSVGKVVLEIKRIGWASLETTYKKVKSVSQPQYRYKVTEIK